jgi:hypothetical protein
MYARVVKRVLWLPDARNSGWKFADGFRLAGAASETGERLLVFRIA